MGFCLIIRELQGKLPRKQPRKSHSRHPVGFGLERNLGLQGLIRVYWISTMGPISAAISRQVPDLICESPHVYSFLL